MVTAWCGRRTKDQDKQSALLPQSVFLLCYSPQEHVLRRESKIHIQLRLAQYFSLGSDMLTYGLATFVESSQRFRTSQASTVFSKMKGLSHARRRFFELSDSPGRDYSR